MDETHKKLSELMSEGFPVNNGDIFEVILLRTISQNLLISAVLQKVIALEHLVKEGTVDFDEVKNEMTAIGNEIAGQSNKQYQSLLADLHLRWNK